MVEVEEVIHYIGTFFLLLSAISSLAVMVLVCFDCTINREYEDIYLFRKSEHPMTYFRVDNGNGTVTKKHNFSYWEGMYAIRNCNYDDYPCEIFVHPVDGFNLRIWRNTTFISENYINYNYFNLLKQAKPRGKPCDEGYKQCGLLDSFNQTLCLLENETCPLNQIELSNSSTPSDIFTNKDAVNTTLLNDNKTYLHTSNAEINSLVITEIVLGPESFCMNDFSRKLGPPYYEYERSSTHGICTEYDGYETDFRYISLDKYTKFNVYNENGIITKIQDFLTYSDYPYPIKELHNYTLHLYKRNYVGFNLTCLGERELNEKSMNGKKKDGTVIGLLILILIFQILGYFSFFVLSLEGDSDHVTYSLYGLVFNILCIPLISISFSSALDSKNLIFQCIDIPITEEIAKSGKLGFTIMTVIFSLYMSTVGLNLFNIIFLNHWLWDKIHDCCESCEIQKEKKKEKRELAQLGFIREKTLSELKTY